jgi:N-acetylmuramoyl-L-alanine amidase
MPKIFIDPGHGGKDTGAVGNGLQEKDITLSIALEMQRILQNEYENVSVQLSRTSDTAVPLSQRAAKANRWGADVYLAIHVNAGGGTGYEDYIYEGLSDRSTTARIRDIIHEEVIRETGFRDRGKKKANFYRKSRLKARGFNRGMKGGVARCPLKRVLRATSFVFGCCSMNKILIQLKPWDKHTEERKRQYL